MKVNQVIPNNEDSFVNKYSYTSFNKDYSNFIAVLDNGKIGNEIDDCNNNYANKNNYIKVYDSNPIQFKLSIESINCYKCKILNRSNFIIYIDNFNKNHVYVWDDIKQNNIIKMEFNESVQDIFISKKNIIIVFIDFIEIYTFNKTPRRINVNKIDMLPRGQVDFIELPNNGSKICYISNRNPTQVYCLNIRPDGNTVEDIQIIKAHKTHQVQLIRFNSGGQYLATCSKKGTVIRIFNSDTTQLIKEYRRGSDQATIFDMSFNLTNEYLAVVSDKDTIHIYQTEKESNHRSSSSSNHSHNHNHSMTSNEYFGHTWSNGRIRLHRMGHNNATAHKGSIREQCKLGWSGNALIVLWARSGIWEKYVCIENKWVREAIREI